MKTLKDGFDLSVRYRKPKYPYGSFDGHVFGSWTVVEECGQVGAGKRGVLCLCKCGIKRKVILSALVGGRSARCRRCGLGTNMPCESWSKDEKIIIREKYREMGTLIVPLLPGRSFDAVKKMAQLMGVRSTRKATPKGRFYSASEIALIKEKYGELGAAKLSKEMGVSPDCLRSKAKKLKIKKRKKSKEEQREALRTRAKDVYHLRVSKGLCKNCGKPVFHGMERCLLHWAVTIADRVGGYRQTNAKRILDILDKQNWKCALTGEVLVPGVNASLDHIIPVSKGGTNATENLQWVTYYVNLSKRDMDLGQFFEMCRRVVVIHESKEKR